MVIQNCISTVTATKDDRDGQWIQSEVRRSEQLSVLDCIKIMVDDTFNNK